MKRNDSFFDHNLDNIRLNLIDAIDYILESWAEGHSVGSWEYCEPGEIYEGFVDNIDVEDEDFYDDVDETNYDPYLGCDFYDCGSYDEW